MKYKLTAETKNVAWPRIAPGRGDHVDVKKIKKEVQENEANEDA